MPSLYYRRDFSVGHCYHIFNRGSHKQTVFHDDSDFVAFTDVIGYYLQFPTGKPFSRIKDLSTENEKDKSSETSFDFLCYCIMPNHFHFLIRQKHNPSKSNSVTNFMRRLSITYAMYYSNKYDHSGNIFQGKYKNIYVKDTTQLLYLSKYIHRNPLEILNKNQKLTCHKFSSYISYLDPSEKTFVNTNFILSHFSKTKISLNYKTFVENDDTLPNSLNQLLLD